MVARCACSAQIGEVVNFAVEGQAQRAVQYGLRARRRKVDDGLPPMAEGHAAVVGPTVAQRVDSGLNPSIIYPGTIAHLVGDAARDQPSLRVRRPIAATTSSCSGSHEVFE